jgi:outer membrane protein assembly factor BamB
MTFLHNTPAPSLRRTLRSAAVACAAMLLAGSAYAGDWPQYRGPHDDAHADEAGVAKRFSAQPKLLWKAPIGEGFGTFAVVGEKAFIYVDRGGRETLVAMNANTGKELWARPVDGTISDNSGGSNPRSTPAVAGDKVYVYSVNLKLVCMSVADGKPLWEHDVKSEMGGKDSGGWGNAISPIVDGDRVYVAGGGSGKAMLAFNKDDGKLVWATGSERITHASPALATIHGVKQLVHFMQGFLVSVAAEDGKELWRAKFPYKVSTAASPVVCTAKNGDVAVYCSAGYDVGSALFKVEKKGDAFAAEQLWFMPFEKGKGHNVNHWSTPLYHDGAIYGIFGFKDFAGGGKKGKANKGGNDVAGGPVRCLDVATHEFKWTLPGFGSGGGTTFVDDHLLVQGDAGKLALIDLSGKQVASFDVPGEKFWSAAIVANGKIFTRSKTEAYCIDVSGK